MDETLAFLSGSLEFLSIAFGVARSMYPNIHCILPVHGLEYSLLLDDKLKLHDIRTLQGNKD